MKAANDENVELFENLLANALENTAKYGGEVKSQQNLMKIVINGQDDLGRTPLHYLAIKNNLKMMDILHQYSKIPGTKGMLFLIWIFVRLITVSQLLSNKQIIV